MIGILGAVAGITDCIAGLEMSVACSGMRAGLGMGMDEKV